MALTAWGWRGGEWCGGVEEGSTARDPQLACSATRDSLRQRLTKRTHTRRRGHYHHQRHKRRRHP